ncbi:MAG TPA: cupin domain-containing protein [Rhodothermales bacterium]|nr:cupin domain-containing protein [Rhodothermales bacterium]
MTNKEAVSIDETGPDLITARLSVQESPEVWWEADPMVRVRADFPLSAEKGSTSTAVVYFELEPGCKLGRHTDSAEEVLLVLQGNAEITVGTKSGQVSAGELVVVPEMVPHSIHNVGDTTVKVVGFFPRGHIVSEFDQPYEPMGQRIFEF